MDKEPVRLQLENGITAQVDWQPSQPKPFWLFGFVDDEAESEEYQLCIFGGQEPMETIYRGIVRYGLPLPLDKAERRKFREWRKANIK